MIYNHKINSPYVISTSPITGLSQPKNLSKESLDAYIFKQSAQNRLRVGGGDDGQLGKHFWERSQGLDMAMVVEALSDQQAIELRKILQLSYRMNQDSDSWTASYIHKQKKPSSRWSSSKIS